ncbi:MAG: cytochrome b N-terminal domain-containing protein [Nitrospinae bacterium]|nr:cytochrome b N-terminal domain-containing protein [Nitrospinota bacterium]
MDVQSGKPSPVAREKAGSRKFIPWILRPGNIILIKVQEWLNRIFTPSLNPFYFLGAVSFFLLWIVIATGVYLWWFYVPTSDGAYESVRTISEKQFHIGGLIRSLHRYASDGLVIVIFLHMLQVLFSDRFRKYRWVAWVSGVAILLPVWIEGTTGYFLVWDKRGQMIAQLTAEWIDAIPVIVEPVSRSFLTEGSLRYIIFFVILYLHMTLTGGLLALAWIHCVRIAKPLINPPKQVGVVIMTGLVALSLIKPATSMAPADLGSLFGTVEMDWFYFIPYYLMSRFAIPASGMWLIGGGLLAILAAMPWIIREGRKRRGAGDPTPALPQGKIEVDTGKCRGCSLCFEACPFEAVNIEPRTDGAPYDMQVSVSPERCAECGFCVTACEFSAVTMDGWSKSSLQDKIVALMAPAADGGAKSTGLVFMCERSIDFDGVLTEDGRGLVSVDGAAVMVIPCIGIISPIIVDHCHKAGAKGVVVVGCRGLDCHYREARRRIKDSVNPYPSTFLVEEMKDRFLKVFLVSPLEVAKLMMDIEKFFDSVKDPSQDEPGPDERSGG